MDQEKKPSKKRPSRKLRWTWLLSIVLLVLAGAGLVLDLYIHYIRKSDLLAPYDAYVLAGLWIVAILVFIPLLIRLGYDRDWTGFGYYTYKKTEDQEIRPAKTLWDWLQLLSALAIPVVLAAAGLWFTAQQDERQRDFEKQRARVAQILEIQRADAEQELAVQRAQDEALQSYLDQIGGLLLKEDLRTSKEGSGVRTLARARTLTVLGRLDPDRKAAVMQFLVEAELVQGGRSREPIISLRGADLSSTNLIGADLNGANLFQAVLSTADLSGANLRGAVLFNANLLDASLSGANLSDANLEDAYLNNADLSSTTLIGADLRGAVVKGADLSQAILSDVGGVTSKGLGEALGEADSLKGVTMPDGQMLRSDDNPNGPTLEDWLRSKNRTADRENE